MGYFLSLLRHFLILFRLLSFHSLTDKNCPCLSLPSLPLSRSPHVWFGWFITLFFHIQLFFGRFNSLLPVIREVFFTYNISLIALHFHINYQEKTRNVLLILIGIQFFDGYQLFTPCDSAGLLHCFFHLQSSYDVNSSLPCDSRSSFLFSFLTLYLSIHHVVNCDSEFSIMTWFFCLELVTFEFRDLPYVNIERKCLFRTYAIVVDTRSSRVNLDGNSMFKRPRYSLPSRSWDPSPILQHSVFVKLGAR